MLFSNHLVNIAYIHEEGTAMAQIRIHVLHCGKIGVAPTLPARALIIKQDILSALIFV